MQAAKAIITKGRINLVAFLFLLCCLPRWVSGQALTCVTLAPGAGGGQVCTLSVGAIQGFNPSSQSFTISSSNGKLQNVTFSVQYTGSQPVGWVSLSQSNVTGSGSVVVSVSIHSEALALGTYQATIGVSASSGVPSPRQVVVKLSVAPCSQTLPTPGPIILPYTLAGICPGAIVNAASYAKSAAIAPGEIVSVFGGPFDNFPWMVGSVLAFYDADGSYIVCSSTSGNSCQDYTIPSNWFLPSNLADLGVGLEFATTWTTTNGLVFLDRSLNAPVFYLSKYQMNIQIPFEIAGASSVAVQPATASTEADHHPVLGQSALIFPVAPFAPGIFTITGNGAGQGAVQNSVTGVFAAPTGSIPGLQTRPAARGDFLTIYCAGLGAVTNQPATGHPASANPLSKTTTIPQLTIGGVPAEVSFSGLTPGFVGLYQVNVQIPAAAPTDNAVPLTLSIGGYIANQITIAIQSAP